jgi:predicted transcriptional regulator
MGDYELYGGTPPHVADCSTSHAAAVNIKSKTKAIRISILEMIKSRSTGMTCDEVEIALGLRHQTASARIRELVQLGELTNSGQQRPTSSGRKAIVWITPKYL